jgi:hypothetical protein
MNELEGNPSNPKDFHNIGWIQLRMKETEKLSEYMKSQGLDITWWENIKAGKQDPWAKLAANDVNGHMQQFKLNFKGNN